MNYYRQLLCLTMLVMGVSSLFGQTKISGTVYDQKENLKLANTSVMLLQAKDSILVTFGRTDAQGSFQFPAVKPGDYLFISSYPNYGDFFKNLSITDTPVDLGVINMQSRANLLEEVIVTGRIPVVIKGDTTEFDAGSFTVEKNAKVEDLLKVLPGITVDASGKISAQGKTVEKVLVDGEEFFGDDPTFATKNLRADMVDKVQLYEKQSDQAEKTGVDDGQKIQTINLTLKEDAKNGMFGKLSASVGNDGYYDGQAMLNKFKGSQKAAVYFVAGNNGTNGLNWADASKYGGGDSDDMMFDEGSGTTYYINSGQGSGVPTSLVTGFSFSDKWNKDVHKFNANYKYGAVQWEGFEDVLRQNNLPQGRLNTDSYKTFNTDERKHRINMKYDWQLDSLTTLTFNVTANKSKTLSNSDFKSEMTNELGELVNANINKQNGEQENESLNTNFYLGRKFMKKGRFLGVSARFNVNNNEGDSYLNTKTDFYKAGVIDSVGLINQRKLSSSENTSYGVGATFTEPISKKVNLTAGYSFDKNNNTNILDSYNDPSDTGNFNELDSVFSNDYLFNRYRNSYTLGVFYKEDKLDMTLTNRVYNDELSQENRYNGLGLKRSFITYNPLFRGTYKITKNKTLRANYSGSNGIPSLTQIQPLRNNIDPLNIYLGNENLKPSFTHNAGLTYQSFSVLSMQYMFMGLSVNATSDALIQNISTTAEGVSTYKWENLLSERNAGISLYGGMSHNISKKKDIKGEIWLNGSYNTYYNFVDNELNKLNSGNYNLTYSFKRSKASGFDFDISLTPGFQTMKSSLQPETDNNGFTFGSYSNLAYYLPKKFKLMLGVNYSYQAPTKAFDQKFEVVLLNPSISKKFLKSEALEVTLRVNDLLNQNVGFRRTQSSSVFQQTRTRTIQRYAMLNVAWDFNKMFIKK